MEVELVTALLVEPLVKVVEPLVKVVQGEQAPVMNEGVCCVVESIVANAGQLLIMIKQRILLL